MRVITSLLSTHKLAVMLVATITLVSCGSYEYVGSNNDGIYGTSTGEEYYEEVPQGSDNYYANLFAEKSYQYESVPEENAIFTDIESYSSNSNYEGDEIYDDTTYNGGYGSWGDNASTV